MSQAKPLLIELFTEELPPKALQRLGRAFADSLQISLEKSRLLASTQRKVYASPRRLGVMFESVYPQAADQAQKVKGPSTKVGRGPQGEPTQALIKWAEKQGVAVADLTIESDGKQDCFYAQTLLKGALLKETVQEATESAIGSLPIPKLMQYQLADGKTTVSFVRPAHRLTVLYGNDVLPAKVLGLNADRITEGHRFHCPGSISIQSPERYDQQLHQAHVIASFEERRSAIAKQLLEAAQSQKLRLSDDPKISDSEALNSRLLGYLDEVTALVEWPKVYRGQFEADFLKVPQECLILTMRTNQKYFPLFDQNGQLQNQFLIVSNLDIDDPSKIIDGNERVIRPRLADARFFYAQDQKQALHQRVEGLERVVYHAKLGTQAERVQRIGQIAGLLAARLGYEVSFAQRAALLAKCDLLTSMVGEFPELQGIMGRYYAEHDGEPSEVSKAIAEQYLPRFAGDILPATRTGTCLALADKLETLTGIWGVGQQPTGDRDPFALRRHCLGILRIIIEGGLNLRIDECLQIASEQFREAKDFKADPQGLSSFVLDRLRGYLKERGYDTLVIEAVLASDPNQLNTLIKRLDAVTEFSKHANAGNLAAANKRIGNILRKSAEGEKIPSAVSTRHLNETAEQQLHKSLEEIEPVVLEQFEHGEYREALMGLAQLRGPVDQFFDQVMVMAEDQTIRQNRLALLARLHRLMNQGADLAKLAA